MPPVINKQRANPGNSQPKSPPGSMLSQVVSVSELEEDFVKIVLYGQNRVGKTTLACQWPKPILLISFEPGKMGGAKSVKKIEDVRYIQVVSVERAKQLALELASDTYYKTHVIDTVTSCQDIVLQEILGLKDAPVQLNWGTVSRDQYRERSEKTREVLRPFRDLAAHTVFLAQEKDHNPPKDETSKLTKGLQLESFFAADLGGATVKWLHDACGYIARLYIDKERKVITTKTTLGGKPMIMTEEVETGRLVRKLRTMYHPNYAAGFRSENPKAVPECIIEPTYEKILKVIRGEMLLKGQAEYEPQSESQTTK